MERGKNSREKSGRFSLSRLLPFILFFCLVFSSVFTFAQSWEFIRSFPVPKTHKFQPDRYGNLFLADKNGNIFKLDSMGRTLETYSPVGVALPSDLQVSQSVNVFVFYEDWQRFVLLDRFLGNARTYEFTDSEEVGYVKSACWASDGNVWLFDQSDFSLKKYNPTSQSVISSFPFNFNAEIDDLEITQLREYEGKIIGLSDNQILIFSFTGNLEWTHTAETEISEISFKSKSVFWIAENEVLTWDFFNNNFHSINLPEGFSKWQASGNCWIGYKKNQLCFYKNNVSD